MREKLIEILRVPIYPHELVDPIEAVADYLIDSGVTIPVRCKDCKYAENMMPIGNGNGYLMGDCTLRKEDDIIVTAWEDEFCSYGERKGDGNDD